MFIVSPFLLLYSLTYSKSKYEDREFNLKFGDLVNEFNLKTNKLNIYYYPIFMFRRLEYIIVQIFLLSYPWIQVWLNISFSLLFFAFLIWARPFKDLSAMIATLIGEICVLLVFIGSSLFLFFDDKEIIQSIESTCIYLILSTVSIQILIAMFVMAKKIKILWMKIDKARSLQFAKNVTSANLRLEAEFH